MRYLVLLALLSSCAPTFTQGTEPRDDNLIFRTVPADNYMALEIDAGSSPIRNAVLELKGTNLRYNEPRCRINDLTAICDLGSLLRYKMAFKGLLDRDKTVLTYYRADGQLYRRTLADTTRL